MREYAVNERVMNARRQVSTSIGFMFGVREASAAVNGLRDTFLVAGVLADAGWFLGGNGNAANALTFGDWVAVVDSCFRA